MTDNAIRTATVRPIGHRRPVSPITSPRLRPGARIRSVAFRDEPPPGDRLLVVVGVLLRSIGQPHLRPFDLLVRKIGRATSELQSPCNLVCRLLLEKKKPDYSTATTERTVNTGHTHGA